MSQILLPDPDPTDTPGPFFLYVILIYRRPYLPQRVFLTVIGFR